MTVLKIIVCFVIFIYVFVKLAQYLTYRIDTKQMNTYAKANYNEYINQFNKVNWDVVRHLLTDEIRLKASSGDLIREGKIMFNYDGMLLNIFDYYRVMKHMKKYAKSIQTEQNRTYWRE